MSETVAVAASSRRRSARTLLLVVVPVLVCAAVAAVYLMGGRYVETDNAYVKATKVPLSSEVSGSVKEVLVHENDSVAAGQVLFRLDPEPFEVAVQKAEAKLAQAKADAAALKASYREKEAEIIVAKTRLAYARHDRKRQEELVAKRFVSASALDQAEQNADLAAREIDALEQDLRRIAETLGGSVDAPLERYPGYLAAQAELREARFNLDRATVRASLAGTVGKPPKPGQYLSAGNTALALVARDGLWVEAEFPETDLTYVRPGQHVTLKVDTFPDARIEGTVQSLSPATGAEFSVLPAQNATGNWVKITQRVPVRIALAQTSGLPPLRAGLSTTAEIDTEHRRRLFGFSL